MQNFAASTARNSEFGIRNSEFGITFWQAFGDISNGFTRSRSRRVVYLRRTVLGTRNLTSYTLRVRQSLMGETPKTALAHHSQQDLKNRVFERQIKVCKCFHSQETRFLTLVQDLSNAISKE